MSVLGKASWKKREVAKSDMKLERMKMESHQHHDITKITATLSNFSNNFSS